jgi:hypothetical protein
MRREAEGLPYRAELSRCAHAYRLAHYAWSKVELSNGWGCEEAPRDQLGLIPRGAQRLDIPLPPMGSSFACRAGEFVSRASHAQSTAVLVMDLEALKLELLHCLERAEEADRDDVRRQWLSAAETWQSAIESRAQIQHLTIEWATLKSVAGSPRTKQRRLPVVGSNDPSRNSDHNSRSALNWAT